MDFAPAIKKVYTTSAYDFIQSGKIIEFATEAGWILHDDQTSLSDCYVVFKSNDSATDDTQSPCYIMYKAFSASPTYFRSYFHIYWDNVTHTGRHCCSYNPPDDHYTSVWGRYCINVDSTSNVVTCYGNKHFLNIAFLRQDTSKLYRSFLFKTENIVDKGAYLISDIDMGENVVLPLSAGQASKFNIGESFLMLDKNSHQFENVKINGIDKINDTITADSILRSTTAGAYIGPISNIYPWVYIFEQDDENIESWSTYHYVSHYIANYVDKDEINIKYDYYNLFESVTCGPTDSSIGNKISLSDVYFTYDGSRTVGDNGDISDGPGEVFGLIPYIKHYAHVVEGETYGYNRIDFGSATTTASGSVDSLTDSNKNWQENEFSGNALIIINGISAGDIKHILTNTQDTLTISGTFTNGIDTTSEYGIFDSAYVGCKSNVTTLYGNHRYRYLLRIA